jgi:hypothetical protein
MNELLNRAGGDEMTATKKLWIMALAAVLVVGCTCSLLPFGIDLSQNMRLGRYITVYYPEDWYGTEDYGIGLFTPEYVDLDTDEEDIDHAMFIVLPLEEYLGSDWHEYIEEQDDLLDELALEFDVDLHSTTTIEAGDVRWARGSFSGPFGDFPGLWEGWLAINLLPEGGAIVIAAAPESDWNDVDNIFEAMMREMEISG